MAGRGGVSSVFSIALYYKKNTTLTPPYLIRISGPRGGEVGGNRPDVSLSLHPQKSRGLGLEIGEHDSLKKIGHCGVEIAETYLSQKTSGIVN